ncbi:MAG: acetate--CoA ligase family protein, partial [Desulfohalobiaceae bacterium]|nr:acetate--CoA ligase family protein [Desulfohalobiaceae bacterium]
SYDPKAKIEGVLIQKMADPGEEVILGMNRYPIFGPLLMFGFGGIFVEVFKDVQFRLAPVGRNEARSMIRGIKGYKLLTGFRGRARADVEKIEKLLVSLSDMAVNHPEIMEMDLNPLLVHSQGQGATVADCRIILQEKAEESEK